MQVLLNVLMGLRRSEINGVKYSDVDYINHTLKVERQLGRVHNAVKEDFASKTFTKQEVGLKTKSSYREIPIPDYVFEAILKERQVYEKNRNRRKRGFQDLGYICCSTLGRARAKGSIAGIISSFLLKTVYRISAGTIYAAHTVLFC